MTDSRLLALVDDLREGGESATVEFKEDNTDAEVIGRWEFRKGYAVCLDAVNDYVNALVPSPEDNGAVARRRSRCSRQLRYAN